MEKMKLAMQKVPSHIPMNYHYWLFPMPMNTEMHLHGAIFAQMGYTIVEMDKEDAERLLKASRESINHQVEVAHIYEKETARQEKEGFVT